MAEEVHTAHRYNGKEDKIDGGVLRSDQESDAEGQVEVSKGSTRSKKSAFQITSVVTKPNDSNHGAEEIDSQDELEESRLEEASSSELLDMSNISKASMNSEVDKSLDDIVPRLSLPDRTAIPTDIVNVDDTTSSEGTTEANGNGPSRFRVVKVPNPEPVTRGRWICKDFPSETSQKQLNQERSELISKEIIHSGDSSTASSVHYVPGDNSLECSNAQTGDDKPSSKRNISRHISSSSRKFSALDMLITGEDNDSSAASAGAIDNKIEQAMDIVKGHLLMAVREEVEVLKEKISELLDVNSKLLKENTMLRKEKGSSQTNSQMMQHMNASAPTQETQFQVPTATPMHSTPYHQQPLSRQQRSSSTSTGVPPTEQTHYQQPQTPSAHHHHQQAVESAQQYHHTSHIADAQVIDQTSYQQRTIPSQQPGALTTNTTEQYHHPQATHGQPLQDSQYSLQHQPAPGTSITRPLSDQSQYQPNPAMGLVHSSSEQQYQPLTHTHHQIGASQERSQVVPQGGAIPHTPQQGTQMTTIPHGKGQGSDL